MANAGQFSLPSDFSAKRKQQRRWLQAAVSLSGGKDTRDLFNNLVVCSVCVRAQLAEQRKSYYTQKGILASHFYSMGKNFLGFSIIPPYFSPAYLFRYFISTHHHSNGVSTLENPHCRYPHITQQCHARRPPEGIT